MSKNKRLQEINRAEQLGEKVKIVRESRNLPEFIDKTDAPQYLSTIDELKQKYNIQPAPAMPCQHHDPESHSHSDSDDHIPYILPAYHKYKMPKRPNKHTNHIDHRARFHRDHIAQKGF